MTREQVPDVSYIVRLRDLGGIRPVPEWRPITWAECPQCGAADPYTTAGTDETVYDGEPVVCPDCGCVGTTSVDAEGAYVAWREEESLTDAALAGLRRLLRMLP